MGVHFGAFGVGVPAADAVGCGGQGERASGFAGVPAGVWGARGHGGSGGLQPAP
jgi:hypothetical protein